MKLPIQSYQHKSKALKTLITGIIMLLAIGVKAQQTGSYTQYMDNQTPLNPAYSLLDKAGSVNALVRQQYVGVQGAPNTFIFNGNLPIESINGASGLIIDNDNFAIEHQFTANLYFAKAVQLSDKGFLSVGLDFGLRNYIADYSGLAPDDPAFRNDVRETKANIGFGVMYFSDEYYIGVSVPQLTFRDLGNGSLVNNDYFRNHYYFSAGIIENLGEDIKIKPAALVSYVRGVPLIADISTTFYFKNALGLGINYRTNNEMAGIVSYNIGQVHIGYSYQFGTTSSNIGGLSNATHEVTLTYRFGKAAKDPKLL